MATPHAASQTVEQLAAPPTVEQPGALDLYPPSRIGSFAVPRDHFRYDASSSTPFGLKYLLYDGFAANATAPVLFYCGNEGAVELFYNNSGALFSLASGLRARVLFAEHRYYGASLPFGGGSFTPANLSLLSIEQALADYAALLLALPAELGCRSLQPPTAPGRELCDVVLFGGSYGGMLAAWHRVRYPQLSLGAVASGAPVDFYPGERMQHSFAAAVNATYATYGGRAGCAPALAAALAAADAAAPEQLTAAGVRACHPMREDAGERYAFYARAPPCSAPPPTADSLALRAAAHSLASGARAQAAPSRRSRCSTTRVRRRNQAAQTNAPSLAMPGRRSRARDRGWCFVQTRPSLSACSPPTPCAARAPH